MLILITLESESFSTAAYTRSFSVSAGAINVASVCEIYLLALSILPLQLP